MSKARPLLVVGSAALTVACAPAQTPPPSASAVVAAAPVDAAVEVKAAAAPSIAGEPQGSFLTNAVVTSTDVPNAEEVILAARPSFKRCYEATRNGGAHFGGMVTCSMRLDKSGKVAAVSVVRRSQLPNPMVDCLITALKATSFGPLDRERMVVVPIRFEED